MSENRKNIIVNEIISWKKNRMLPEQYCDYLLALYTEGNQPDISENKVVKKKSSKKQFLFLLLIPLTMFLIHFTELSITLQITFSILSILAGIIFTFYFSRKGISMPVPLIVSALILLLTSVEFISQIFPEGREYLLINLFINCLLWLLAGWKLKFVSFTISGVLGLLLLVISIFI